MLLLYYYYHSKINSCTLAQQHIHEHTHKLICVNIQVEKFTYIRMHISETKHWKNAFLRIHLQSNVCTPSWLAVRKDMVKGRKARKDILLYKRKNTSTHIHIPCVGSSIWRSLAPTLFANDCGIHPYLMLTLELC